MSCNLFLATLSQVDPSKSHQLLATDAKTDLIVRTQLSSPRVFYSSPQHSLARWLSTHFHRGLRYPPMALATDKSSIFPIESRGILHTLILVTNAILLYLQADRPQL